MGSLLQDLRHTARALLRAPGFVLIVILTLTLGIGANAGIFSVVNTVLLKPVPYADANRIVMFGMTRDGERAFGIGSPTKFNVWRRETATFEDVSAFRFGFANVTGGIEPEEVTLAQASAAFFRLFGAGVQAHGGGQMPELPDLDAWNLAHWGSERGENRRRARRLL